MPSLLDLSLPGVLVSLVWLEKAPAARQWQQPKQRHPRLKQQPRPLLISPRPGATQQGAVEAPLPKGHPRRGAAAAGSVRYGAYFLRAHRVRVPGRQLDSIHHGELHV